VATNFPASLDSLTNPTSSDSLNSPSHSAQHANSNDAIEALQAKVGVDSSAVTTSLDYKVAQLEAITHGKILQVVTTTIPATTYNSTGYTTIASLVITPSSASSKILLFSSAASRHDFPNPPFYNTQYHRIYHLGSTTVVTKHELYVSFAGGYGNELTQPVTMAAVHSPASTSAETYQYQIQRATDQMIVQDGFFVAMEVSA